jgi:hypothetical protein
MTSITSEMAFGREARKSTIIVKIQCLLSTLRLKKDKGSPEERSELGLNFSGISSVFPVIC